VLAISLFACGGGSTEAGGSGDGEQFDCVNFTSVAGGFRAMNECDFEVNVAFFDPLLRFPLKKGETKFIERTESLDFGVCGSLYIPISRKNSTTFTCRRG